LQYLTICEGDFPFPRAKKADEQGLTQKTLDSVAKDSTICRRSLTAEHDSAFLDGSLVTHQFTASIESSSSARRAWDFRIDLPEFCNLGEQRADTIAL
jgi:hypothetical protein